jgi:glycosyltransferase involved in cell wall biosynthesis
MNIKKISIAIPSANRIKELKEVVFNISKSGLNLIEEVLIVNDGYDEATMSKSFNSESKIPIRVVSNKYEKGFARAFVTLIEEVKTEYFIFMTDDDVLNIDHISHILNHIQHSKPAIISPSWLGSNSYPLRSCGKNTVISMSTLLKYTAHAPGLVFNTALCKGSIEQLKSIINENIYFSLMYPQVILGGLLLKSSQQLVAIPLIIGKDNHDIDTGLVSDDGSAYFTFYSRSIQLASLDKLGRSKNSLYLDSSFFVVLQMQIMARVMMMSELKIVISAIMIYLTRALKVRIYKFIKNRPGGMHE